MKKHRAGIEKGEAREKQIKQAFKDQGSDNSNTGNVARTFFMEYKKSSRITGIDMELICRLHIILLAVSSCYSIDATKFEAYAMETAELYINRYKWYPMTVTLHNILLHALNNRKSIVANRANVRRSIRSSK